MYVNIPRLSDPLTRAGDFALPLAIAVLAASAAYAGADTTFSPALTKFTLQADVPSMFSSTLCP